MAFSLKKMAKNIIAPVKNVIKNPTAGNIGEALYGLSPVGAIDNAIGSPLKNAVTGAVGKAITTPKVSATTINSSTPALDKITQENQARTAGIGTAIAAGQKTVQNRATPKMSAVLMDPNAVQKVSSQDVGPGTAVAMDTSGVQRVVAGQGAQLDTSGINKVTSTDVGPLSPAERIARENIQNAQALSGGTATAAQLNMAQQEQQRAQQLALGEQLAAQAAGTAPSVAAMQAKQQGDRALAAQLALAAGQSGSQVPLAMRTTAQQQAGIGAEIANQSAILRLQEQQAAQKAAAELATNVRGQDINVATTQAGMEQQTNIANLQAAQADVDRALRADLANQGVDLDVLKTNAAAGNAAAIAQLQSAQQNAERQVKAQMANQSTATTIAQSNLQAQMADMDRVLRADLANQGVDLDKAKADAAAGNAMALANLSVATQNADRLLKADMANQGVNLDILKQNAAAGNAAAAANLQAALQKMGLDDAMQRAYMQNQLDLNKQQTDQVMEAARIKSAESVAQAQLKQQAAIANQAAATSQMGGLMSAGGALGAAAIAASDINLKKDIKKTTKSLGEFLSSLSVSDYEYKDPKWGKGKQTSVMAQELDKSEIGRKAVINTPEGKLVDYSKLMPAMLAANVDAHKRISTLEQALKARNKK